MNQRCKRCMWEWEAKVSRPRVCPRCKSYKWEIGLTQRTHLPVAAEGLDPSLPEIIKSPAVAIREALAAIPNTSKGNFAVESILDVPTRKYPLPKCPSCKKEMTDMVDCFVCGKGTCPQKAISEEEVAEKYERSLT